MSSLESLAGKKTGIIMLIIAWLVGMFLAMKFFATWENNQINPNKNPQTSSKTDYNEVILLSGKFGSYLADGYINDQSAVLMLDTGASRVCISETLARRLNLKKGIPISLDTVNGITEGWLTNIDSIRLGTISISNISAVILPNMDDEVLLGMTFLKGLEIIKHSNGQLILRQYKSNK